MLYFITMVSVQLLKSGMALSVILGLGVLSWFACTMRLAQQVTRSQNLLPAHYSLPTALCLLLPAHIHAHSGCRPHLRDVLAELATTPTGIWLSPISLVSTPGGF